MLQSHVISKQEISFAAFNSVAMLKEELNPLFLETMERK